MDTPNVRLMLKALRDSRSKKPSDRSTLFPLRDPEAYEYYIKQQKLIWVATEIKTTEDHKFYLMLTPEQQEPLKNALTIFQVLDSDVIDEPVLRFLLESDTIEEKLPYIAQLDAEGCKHAVSYALQIQGIIPDQIELKELTKKIDTLEWVHDFRNFLDKYVIEEDHPLPVALAAQAIMEGVGFQQFFAIIFWYKFSPIVHDIPGVTASNELISREEAVHAEYAIFRYNREIKKLQDAGVDTTNIEKKVLEMFDEMEDITRRSLPFIIPIDIDILTKENVLTYCRLAISRIKGNMGYPAEKVVNKLKYMESVGALVKSNFYERQTTAYSRGNRHGTKVDDEDF